MCYDEGILQAYADGELTEQESIAIREHLVVCAACAQKLATLQANTVFVNDCLAQFQAKLNDHKFKPAKAWAMFATDSETAPAQQKGGVFTLLKRYHKAAVVATLVVAMVGILGFTPLGSAAAELLKIFRVEQIETITLSAADLEQIRSVIGSGNGDINLDNFGKVEVVGNGEYRAEPVSIDVARQKANFPVKELRGLPFAYDNSEIMYAEPQQLKFTLDVANTNAVIKTFGGKNLLPDSVDGKTFTIKTPGMVMMNYYSGEGPATRYLHIIQTQSPEIIVPDGTDVDSIWKALVDLPVLPENVRKQLLSVQDWQHTMLIPGYEGLTKEVMVNGNQGVFIASPNKDGASSLIWKENDLLYVISGNHSLAEAQQIAAALR